MMGKPIRQIWVNIPCHADRISNNLHVPSFVKLQGLEINISIRKKMAYNFQGRKYIVTGAGGGLGSAIAESLNNKGAKVYALDYAKEALDELVEKMSDIVAVHQDLTNWEETAEKVDQLGVIDGLVNCAGILIPQMVVDVTKENLYKHYDINLSAPINLMQVVGKKMIAARQGGSIVNISSCSSKGASKGILAYSVSKAGLDMATKMFALELGPHKIRVNTVHPGLIPTSMSKSVCTEEAFKEAIDKMPLSKQLTIQNVVDLVMFLLSDQSEMITGTSNVVDGGYTCQLP